MLGLALVVTLGVGVLVAHTMSARLRVPAPIALLTVGVLVGFVPTVRQAQLPPEVVLLLFLPVLLYWESLTTSLREIRANFTGIVLLSTALVVLTAWAVAAIGHLIGLSWPVAWVLGAALAPTDATAVSALGRLLPRRQLTILRAESLVNDGTALVVFAVAVSAAADGADVTALSVMGSAVLSYAGGVAVGAAVAWVNAQLRRRLDDPLLGNLVMLLAPFTAFLLAELLHASGVLAVVVSGLIMSQVAPRIIRAEHRTQALAFWPLMTFVINGSLFVLVGVELQSAARQLDPAQLGAALVGIALCALVLLGVRFAFLTSAAGLGHLRPLSRIGLRDLGGRSRVVSALAGFRGAVSLAVALSIPETVAGGGAFPARDLVVAITSGVILVTLVLQGALLPAAVRWARLPEDRALADEVSGAEVTALQVALEELPGTAARQGASQRAHRWVREEYEAYLAGARAHTTTAAHEAATTDTDAYSALALAMVQVRRGTVLRLRDERVIDDIVLRRLQTRLDDEELRLRRREPLE